MAYVGFGLNPMFKARLNSLIYFRCFFYHLKYVKILLLFISV